MPPGLGISPAIQGPRPTTMPERDSESDGLLEIPLVGDLTDGAADLCDKLLSVPPGGECIIYFDSLGGNPYTATASLR